jgi:hypothetical protein
LSLLIDSLDAYVGDCVVFPQLVQTVAAAKRLSEARDATARFEALAHLTGQYKTDTWALMNVARMWRHRLVHQRSRAKLHPLVKKSLLAWAPSTSSGYQGLDVDEMIARAESGASPRFKEAAAMFRAAHSFVQAADDALITKLDLEEFCESVLRAYIFGAVDSVGRIARVANIWGKDPARRERAIENLLHAAGLSVASGPSNTARASTTVAALADQTVTQARRHFEI